MYKLSRALVFQVTVEFGFTTSRRFLDNFVLLNIPHHVHDALVDLDQVSMLQGAAILLLHLWRLRRPIS